MELQHTVIRTPNVSNSLRVEERVEGAGEDSSPAPSTLSTSTSSPIQSFIAPLSSNHTS